MLNKFSSHLRGGRSCFEYKRYLETKKVRHIFLKKRGKSSLPFSKWEEHGLFITGSLTRLFHFLITKTYCFLSEEKIFFLSKNPFVFHFKKEKSLLFFFLTCAFPFHNEKHFTVFSSEKSNPATFLRKKTKKSPIFVFECKILLFFSLHNKRLFPFFEKKINKIMLFLCERKRVRNEKKEGWQGRFVIRFNLMFTIRFFWVKSVLSNFGYQI